MADPSPIRGDARRARDRRRVPPDAACSFCGELNPAILREGETGVLQNHHLGGRANDADLEVVLCLNHHHLNTLGQGSAGVELRRDPARSMPERLESVLRGLAVFFELLARQLMGWADGLGALVAALDGNCPAWRALPEAQMS
jgi:hypothetical protein